MLQTVTSYLSTNGFMPHGYCLLWKPSVFWTMVFSDAVITVSYLVIPMALIYFIKKRKDMPFKAVFILFGAFILFCGLSHLLSIIVMWKALYGLQAILLLMTAIVSALTAFFIWFQIPILLSIPSPSVLENKKKLLQKALDELREHQEKTRTLFDAAPDAMLVIDEEGYIIDSNTRANELFKTDSKGLNSKLIDSLVPSAYRSGHRQKRESYMRSPEARPMGNGLELMAIDMLGNEFPVEVSLSPIQSGNATQIIATVRDISLMKWYENRIKQNSEILALNKELEQKNHEVSLINQELESFSYSVAHDLKEPIRGINNYASIIVEDYEDMLPKEGKALLSKLPSLCQRQTQLINTILEYATINRSNLDFKLADLNICLEETLQANEHLFTENNIELIKDNPLPKKMCDHIRVSEIFQNLLTNAIKYNDSDPVIIRIGYIDKQDIIYVKDNGIGIAPESKQKVFKIFSRLHRKDSYGGGLGAGLSLTKKIVEQHEGKIWFESEKNQGTCFYFSLSPVASAK